MCCVTRVLQSNLKLSQSSGTNESTKGTNVDVTTALQLWRGLGCSSCLFASNNPLSSKRGSLVGVFYEKNILVNQTNHPKYWGKEKTTNKLWFFFLSEDNSNFYWCHHPTSLYLSISVEKLVTGHNSSPLLSKHQGTMNKPYDLINETSIDHHPTAESNRSSSWFQIHSPT